MEQEKSSGKVLFESLREQFKILVPKKPLRILIATAAVFLTLLLIVGIVSGSIAIAPNSSIINADRKMKSVIFTIPPT
jgi:hypothetical protein